MKLFYFKFVLFFLLIFSFSIETIYGLETEWSSEGDGFSKVTWKGVSFASQKEDPTLCFLKAVGSLYQGLESSENLFNPSPNFATLTIGLVIKTSKETQVFHFPVKDPKNQYIIFSSSNRGVYGKDLLRDVAEYLEIPSEWSIYSYGDLYKNSDPFLIRQKAGKDTQIHSEDLMAIFMNSPDGKRFLRRCLKTIKESLKEEESLEIVGGEARIYSFWDVCEGCLTSLKSSCLKIFLPDQAMADSFGFLRSASPFYLLNTFSEMPYCGNPPDLTTKPKIINSQNTDFFLIVSSRRQKKIYENLFSLLLGEFKDDVTKYTPSPLPTPKKRRAIESDDEFLDQDISQKSEVTTPEPVLKWMGMSLFHPQNREVFFKAGLSDEDLLTFCSKALLPQFWGYPFAHHYGWESWEALKKEKRIQKTSFPFLSPYEKGSEKTPNPPFLLLSGERSQEKSKRHVCDLQRKWLAYNPYKYAIPHFGWSEIAVIDVEEGVGLTNVGEKAQCQMCGNTKLVHLHHVFHSRADRHLFVGSECVQFMTLKKEEVLENLKISSVFLDKILSSQPEKKGQKRTRLKLPSHDSDEEDTSENEAVSLLLSL
ncbi:MAG: hypothetical protein JSS34_06915 [Proteobacteria bacterium]|nr:hypothetical protein [Pseudomonadota bacterium]